MQHRKTNLNTSSLSFAALLAACATDGVDLGGSSTVEQNLGVGARCVESRTVEDDVFVASQEELEALRGCEAIRGDFTVMVFEGTDLSPLASLREVSGALLLGAYARPIPDEILVNPMGNELADAFAAQEAEAERSNEIVEAGWLESLHGFEALERAGEMTLSSFAAPDLRAFESLRTIDGKPGSREGGSLDIREARNLVDLRGLEGVTGIGRLSLSENPVLQSLAGIELGIETDSVSMGGNPQLTDLTALSSLESLESLGISETAIENLDALANLTSSLSVTLVANSELTDVSGLRNLQLVSSMIVMSNPKLVSIPEIPLLSGVEEFLVLDNAALRSVSLNFYEITTTNLDRTIRFNSEPPPRLVEREIEAGIAWLDISDNPQLESLAVVGTLTSALVFEVTRNAGLSRIDLGSLRSLNVLSIAGNATLSEVALGDIETINLLSVVDNPNLAVGELRNVRTFETVTSGNADDTGE
jgi:hypothetical protein